MAKPPSRRSSSGEIAQFLNKSKTITQFVERQPRLIFAIDATASRQPTWDTACQIQAGMFRATSEVATLAIQLCYYRGFNEFHASRWLTDSTRLGQLMASVYCEGGHTQIARVLRFPDGTADRLFGEATPPPEWKRRIRAFVRWLGQLLEHDVTFTLD